MHITYTFLDKLSFVFSTGQAKEHFFLKCTLIDRMATRAGRAAVSALKFEEAYIWCMESV